MDSTTIEWPQEHETPGTARGAARAAAANRRYANRLGWQVHLPRIAKLLGVTAARSDDERLVAAVRRWQQRHGLAADGIVGPDTWRNMSRALGQPVTGRTAPRHTSAGCAAPARMATDRCTNPGTRECPAIPDLICVSQVDGIPFHYPTAFTRGAQTRLTVITKRQRTRTQRFKPDVQAALSEFLANMRRFGMPVEVIITYGSLYCRCIKNTDKLSNHSFGDAIDIVGVRWPAVGGPRSALQETIVHNFRDQGQRVLLRRIDACLRLSFTRVIDYHTQGHQDHFHCDMNRGGPPRPRERVSLRFAQEALRTVLGRPLPVTGRLDAATRTALRDFSGVTPAALAADEELLGRVLRDLFRQVAADG